MKASEILSAHKLKNTQSRQEILDVFTAQPTALSQADIIRHLGKEVDRVTVYRTLNTLAEKGVLHKIFDGDSSVKYAVCSTKCSGHDHHHDHVHFKCTQCDLTECLDEVHISLKNLPAGYKVKDSNFLLVGICKRCA